MSKNKSNRRARGAVHVRNDAEGFQRRRHNRGHAQRVREQSAEGVQEGIRDETASLTRALDPEVAEFLRELHRSLDVKQKGALTIASHPQKPKKKSTVKKIGVLLRFFGRIMASAQEEAEEQQMMPQVSLPVAAKEGIADAPTLPAPAAVHKETPRQKPVVAPVATAAPVTAPTPSAPDALAEVLASEQAPVRAATPLVPVRRNSLWRSLFSRRRAPAVPSTPQAPARPGFLRRLFARKKEGATKAVAPVSSSRTNAIPQTNEKDFIMLSSESMPQGETGDPSIQMPMAFASDMQEMAEDAPLSNVPMPETALPGMPSDAPLVPPSAMAPAQAKREQGFFHQLTSFFGGRSSQDAGSTTEQTQSAADQPNFFGDAESPFAKKNPKAKRAGLLSTFLRRGRKQEASTEAPVSQTSNLRHMQTADQPSAAEKPVHAARRKPSQMRAKLHKALPTFFPQEQAEATDDADAELNDELLQQLQSRSAKLRLKAFLNSNFPTFFPSGNAPASAQPGTGGRRTSAFAQDTSQIVLSSESLAPQPAGAPAAAGGDALATNPGRIMATSSRLESIRSPNVLEQVLQEQAAAAQAAQQQPLSNLQHKVAVDEKPAPPPESAKIAKNVKKRLDILHIKEGGFHDFLGAIKYFGLGKERMALIQNLATMLNAGLPLVDALHTLQKETRPRPLKKMLQNVVDAVENGSALWRALAAQHFFSPHAISLIRIGEEAGNLAQNMEHLADQEEKDAALKGKIKMAMIYPAIVIVLMFIIVMGLGLFVLPNLIGVLFSLNVKLPLITRILIAFTNGFTKYATVVVPSTLGGSIMLVILAKFTPAKVFFQWITFHIPGIGRLMREATIARFGVILGSLLEAGVPLIEAVNSLAEVTTIVAYRNFYLRLLEHINLGDSFGKSFELIHSSNALLPISVQQLVMTGEKSGSLAKIMMKISDIYEKKANDTAQKLPVILEPLLLLFIGALVGTIAIAIIVPIYSVVGSVQKT